MLQKNPLLGLCLCPTDRSFEKIQDLKMGNLLFHAITVLFYPALMMSYFGIPAGEAYARL